MEIYALFSSEDQYGYNFLGAYTSVVEACDAALQFIKRVAELGGGDVPHGFNYDLFVKPQTLNTPPEDLFERPNENIWILAVTNDAGEVTGIRTETLPEAVANALAKMA